MQNNRKILGISLIILGVIIIALIIYFAFFKKAPNVTGPEINEASSTAQLQKGIEAGTTTPSDIARNRQEYDISKEAAHVFNLSDLEERSKFFAAGFGSYSNQSNYGNFTDFKIYMTDSFSTWTDKYVEDLRAKDQASASYYGIVTYALGTEVKSFNDKVGKAEIIVSTKRIESTAAIGDKAPYLQKITLDFVKVNGDWLVDAAYWEKL
jgi:hypothetical protein